MLFWLWEELPYRPTRDLDLLGYGPDDAERLRTVFTALCAVDVPADGLVFDPSTISIKAIREESRYHGQRVKLLGFLERTRLSVQVDVGFGDAVVPTPDEVVFPSLLGHPAAQLRAYRRETVVAEKLHALVEHGLATSRIKDLVDLWHLAQHASFAGAELVAAIAATFQRRGTALPLEPPALTTAFSDSPVQQQLWQSFLARSEMTEEPPALPEVIASLAGFLLPPVVAVATSQPLTATWAPGGPWRPTPRVD